MNSTLQSQRSAIESLKGYTSRKLPRVFVDTVDFLLEMTLAISTQTYPLYALGISDGFGNNSQFRGMKVLIMGERKPDTENPALKSFDLAQCEYIVLVRQATSEEYAQQNQNRSIKLRCVQLLEFYLLKNNTIILKSSNKRACYTKI